MLDDATRQRPVLTCRLHLRTQQLAARQAERKREREARRQTLHARDHAARVIQQAARRYLVWRAPL